MTHRRLLIVSPHFPPVNAPDMQRVRLALPYLRELDWEPTVLAVQPNRIEGAVLDPLLEQTYPEDIRVQRVAGIPPRIGRRFGVGSLWWRCGRSLQRAADELFDRERFDLVFFSTTQFDTFTLGSRWLRQWGVPYVLDYQDPWINDHYRETNTRPPGGRLKFWLSQSAARRHEPTALKSAAGVIAVSSSYGSSLARRYAWFDGGSVQTIPFGVSTLDFELVRQHTPASSLVQFGDGNIHHVYAGRGGTDMHMALTLLFRAFRRYLDTHPASARLLRFHFIGTDYAPPPLGRETVLPVAAREGVAEYVTEHCQRVPYFDALYYLVHADALVVVGSDDASYNASKILPYLFARRPLLTIAHRHSMILELVRRQGLAYNYEFDGASALSPTSISRIHDEWFAREGFYLPPPGNLERLAPYAAAAMTQRMCNVFNQALTPPRR